MPVKPELRKTKIVATIGPACDDLETLKAMILAGMNVARLNLSFGTSPEQHERVGRIRAAAEAVGRNVGIMIDTRGIEIRTEKLEGGALDLPPGALFALRTDGRIGGPSGVSVTYRDLPREVTAGTPILLDDGAIELEVQSVLADAINCRVVHGGRLGENKSVNLPETELSTRSVSPEYREDVIREMDFATKNDVDYIAASFVQSAEDIVRMREILLEKGPPIPIIAKIENKAGVKNLDEIVGAADGVMVARGDLGVELPLADVPATQKQIIRKTVSRGKPVITATQMLASMEYNPKPTRAEASDVANAILDGSSAVMLSGETAAGKYPVQAVRTMATLAVRTEASLREYGYLQKIQPNPSNRVTEAVGLAVVNMAEQLNATAIICLTSTGFTARLISKHRPDCPILALTPSRAVVRKLCMNWGVVPIYWEGHGDRSDEAKLQFTIDRACDLGYVKAGDIALYTAGYRQEAGSTDLIRVITLGA